MAQDEWPLLVVVPASLRLAWAEEIARWLPHLRPSAVHVIEGRTDRLDGSTAPPVRAPLIGNSICLFAHSGWQSCRSLLQAGMLARCRCPHESTFMTMAQDQALPSTGGLAAFLRLQSYKYHSDSGLTGVYMHASRWS